MTQGGMGHDEATGNSEERTDGRPSDVPPATPQDTGRPEQVRDGGSSDEAVSSADPTVAAEEEGEEPGTEHAPGSDL